MTTNEIKEIEKIRKDYVKNETDKLVELKALDKKVKLPAEITAYTHGIIGALVLGTGMTLAMEVIGGFMALGIVVGVLGLAMVTSNFFLYKAILKSRKGKYAERIIKLSDELMG